MKSLAEIKKLLKDHRKNLCGKYPIKSMAIFGSFARMEQKKDSDLDIIVEFNGTIGIRFIDLAEDIEKITGVKVDLVSKKGIKEKYFKTIKSDLIYV